MLNNKARVLGSELNLPDHQAELSKAEEIINNIKDKFKTVIRKKNMDGKQHTALYEETAQILDYVGHLSKAVFSVEEKLEKEYITEYKHTPALGKTLFWKHYEGLHHPYSLLKNRCFRLFEELDREFRKRNKKQFPPNWKI